MGLERIAAVLQGKLSNYETDLLWPDHRARCASLFHVEYGESDRIATTLRICADHARAAAFLINDGVIPSNEGRGYVLRKIMRRAMRNARMIGVEEPFLHKLTELRRRLHEAGVSRDAREHGSRGAHRARRRASVREHLPSGRARIS